MNNPTHGGKPREAGGYINPDKHKRAWLDTNVSKYNPDP